MIVDMILKNVTTTKISKKNLLSILINNILKNEQEEIKTYMMGALFGKNT